MEIVPLTKEDFNQVKTWLTNRAFENKAISLAQKMLDQFEVARSFIDNLDKEIAEREAMKKSLDERLVTLQEQRAQVDGELTKARVRVDREKQELESSNANLRRDAMVAKDQLKVAQQALADFKTNAQTEITKWTELEKGARERYEKFMSDLQKRA